MSHITAHNVLPLFEALDAQEREKFLAAVGAVKKDKVATLKKTKKDPYAGMPDIYRPENKHVLVAAIMRGE